MPPEKRFLFSGFSSAAKRRLVRKIKDLGGHALSSKDLKPDEDFILVCAQPKWTEKFIAACSTGLWILHSDFIEKSCAFGYWLRESQYEWTKKRRHLLGSTFRDERLLEAPQRWRMHVDSFGRKAFQAWNVLIMVRQKTNKEAFTRMLTFGGAVVVRKRECLNDDVWNSLTHVFVDDEFCHHHDDIVKGLVNEGFHCLRTEYIRDYIAQVSTGNSRVKLKPPDVKDYYIANSELLQSTPTHLKGFVSKQTLKGSVGKNTERRMSRERLTDVQQRSQTRRSTQDDRAKEALRASIRALMPPALINREQKEQLLRQEGQLLKQEEQQLLRQKAVIVVESLPPVSPLRPITNGRLDIKRIEVKSTSLVKCSTGRRGQKRKGGADDCSTDEQQQSNVVFETIASKVETSSAPSLDISSSRSSEMQGFRADLKKRRIESDVGLDHNQKRINRILLDTRNKESQPDITKGRRRVLDGPVLKEMMMEENRIVSIQQTDEALLSKKRPADAPALLCLHPPPPLSPPHSSPPLSQKQLSFLKKVVQKTISPPVAESQMDENKEEQNPTHRDRNQREKDCQSTSSAVNRVSSVVSSQVSVIVRRLSEGMISDIQNPVVLLSSSAAIAESSSAASKRSKMRKSHETDRATEESHHKEQNKIEDSNVSTMALSPSDCDGDVHVISPSMASTTSAELLHCNQLPEAPSSSSSSSVALHSNQTVVDRMQPSSSSLSPEVSNADVFEHSALNQTTILSHLECTEDPLNSVAQCTAPSHHRLVSTEKAEGNDSDKGFISIERDQQREQTGLMAKQAPPHSPKKRPFSKTVTMLVEACLGADEGTRFSGQESVKKFVDAISSFLSPVSYPPSATLNILMKLLIEERGIDDHLRLRISSLLDRMLWIHRPISGQMRQIYVDALSHVSSLHQNSSWQLIEHTFRRVFECGGGDGCGSNADLLFLRFIVRFVEVDFEESKKRLLSAGGARGRSVRWSLLTLWLWTNEFAAVRSAQFVQLVVLLITSIRLKTHPDQMVLIGLAQKLVAMAADAWLMSSVVSMETSFVPRDALMLALVIAEQLTADVERRGGIDELKIFLETSQCDWLVMVVCRTLLDRMNPDGVIEIAPLSLRMITNYFDLCPCEAADQEEADVRAKCEPSKRSLLSPKPLVKRNQKPKDVNKTNSKGETQLHVACRKNDVERVRELLQSPGIDVNRADNAGWTPLHEASNHGHTDVVEELLKFKPKRTINSYFTMTGPSDTMIIRGGVNVRAASHVDGITPLHDAVINGHSRVCRLLLDHAGVELVSVVDKKGKTATDYAITNEMKSLLLLEDDHSSSKDTAAAAAEQRATDISKMLRDVPLSCAQSSVEQNITSIGEATARLLLLPAQRQTLSRGRRDRAISSDCAQRYSILVSNVFMSYVSWRRERLSADDRLVLTELEKHVLRLRENLLELQNGTLLTGQVAALARLEALADLQFIPKEEQSAESLL